MVRLPVRRAGARLAPAAIRSGDTIIIVAWVAQTFLQLVLLPIIIAGQNVQAAAAEARALSGHATLQAIHELARETCARVEQQRPDEARAPSSAAP